MVGTGPSVRISYLSLGDDALMRTDIAIRRGSNLLITFLFLQALDIMSTVVFLGRGVEEANPVVRWLMFSTHGAISGLMLTKMAAAGLAYVCYRKHRLDLLRKANIGYAILICWNVAAILVAGAIHS